MSNKREVIDLIAELEGLSAAITVMSYVNSADMRREVVGFSEGVLFNVMHAISTHIDRVVEDLYDVEEEVFSLHHQGRH